MVRRLLWTIPLGILLAIAGGYAVLASFTPRYRAVHLLEANHDFILYRPSAEFTGSLAEQERTLFFSASVLDSVLSDPSLRAAQSLSDPKCAEENLRANS